MLFVPDVLRRHDLPPAGAAVREMHHRRQQEPLRRRGLLLVGAQQLQHPRHVAVLLDEPLPVAVHGHQGAERLGRHLPRLVGLGRAEDTHQLRHEPGVAHRLLGLLRHLAQAVRRLQGAVLQRGFAVAEEGEDAVEEPGREEAVRGGGRREAERVDGTEGHLPHLRGGGDLLPGGVERADEGLDCAFLDHGLPGGAIPSADGGEELNRLDSRCVVRGPLRERHEHRDGPSVGHHVLPDLIDAREAPQHPARRAHELAAARSVVRAQVEQRRDAAVRGHSPRVVRVLGELAEHPRRRLLGRLAAGAPVEDTDHGSDGAADDQVSPVRVGPGDNRDRLQGLLLDAGVGALEQRDEDADAVRDVGRHDADALLVVAQRLGERGGGLPPHLGAADPEPGEEVAHVEPHVVAGGPGAGARHHQRPRPRQRARRVHLVQPRHVRVERRGQDVEVAAQPQLAAAVVPPLAPRHQLPRLPGGRRDVPQEVRERIAPVLAVLVAHWDGDVGEAGVEAVEPVPDELPLEREERRGQGSRDQRTDGFQRLHQAALLVQLRLPAHLRRRGRGFFLPCFSHPL